MRKSLWCLLVVLAFALAIGGCNAHPTVHDGGPLLDASPPAFDAGPPSMDAGTVHSVNVRLVNLIPASPNLTVCIATIPGTGVAPTTAHIIGSPSAQSDGTLPYPAVSPYLTAPVFDAPGFGYDLRLYNRADLPFSALGPCPSGASPAPVARVHIDGSMVTNGGHYAVVLIGVLPGTPVQCTGACPPVQVRVITDDLAPAPPHQFRSRLFNAIPNLPAPIHVCFDYDYAVVGGVVMDGPAPPGRVLPVGAGAPGLAFGEVTTFIHIPPVTTVGAFYTYSTIAGVPDCDPSTLLQGPVTVPLPVPASAPIDVARVFIAGDVVTNFAFGRQGAPCTTAADCVAPSSICTMAPCTCDRTHHCADDLAGNLLPWRDVRGDAPHDAGM